MLSRTITRGLSKRCDKGNFQFVGQLFVSFLSFSPSLLGKESNNIEKKLTSKKHQTDRNFIKILLINGGGIRGIIPALILQEIEGRLKSKTHLTQCFDVMAGASSGAFIVLLLNDPDESGHPKYNMNDVILVE